MINIIAVYDDENDQLGDYFHKCFMQLKNFLLTIKIKTKLIEINSESCSFKKIEEIINQYKNTNFILISYTHGTKEELCNNDIAYLSIRDDLSIFKNVFLYTNACSSGKILGPQFIENGGITFWGYNGVTTVVPAFEDIFRECDNYGIISFLKGLSIKEAFEKSKVFYQEKMIELLEINVPAAVYLIENRDLMIKRGKDDIKYIFFGGNFG